MESNFTAEQIAARDRIIAALPALDAYQLGVIEGCILRMIAEKGEK